MIRTERTLMFQRKYDWGSKTYEYQHFDERRKYTRYILEVEAVEKLNKWLSTNRVSELRHGDSIYFFPNAKFSRAKFRDWARDQNIKVVLDPSAANVLVLGKDILDIKSHNVVHFEVSKQKDLKLDDEGNYYTHEYDEYLQVARSGKEYLCFDESEIKSFVNRGLERILSAPDELPDKKYILVEDLANDMQEMVMDYEAFLSIYRMLKGGDENKVTALELLSNYNFKESVLCIGILKLMFPFYASDFSKVSLAPLKKFMMTDKPLVSVNYTEYMESMLSDIRDLITHVGKDNVDEDVLRFCLSTILGEKLGYPVDWIAFKSEIKTEQVNIGIEPVQTF